MCTYIYDICIYIYIYITKTHRHRRGHRRKKTCIYSTCLGADGVEVEQRLRGVLARAIARIEHRDVGGSGSLISRPLQRMAQHQNIAIALQAADCVGK